MEQRSNQNLLSETLAILAKPTCSTIVLVGYFRQLHNALETAEAYIQELEQKLSEKGEQT